MTISSLFIKEQQEGNIKVDVLFIMMEKVQKGFCEELMKPANQYGYKLNKAAYRTKDIVCGSLQIIPSKRQVFSKEQIYDRIWGEYYVEMTGILLLISIKSVRKLSRISPIQFTFKQPGA